MFGVAWAFVAHTDSHFDAEMLCRFVRAYQEVQPLTIGELWAVAITLRIVLVENLRRLAELIMHSSAARQEANGLADRLLGAGGQVLPNRRRSCSQSARARSCPRHSPSSSCIGCAIRIPRITPALTWLDQHLAAQGSTADTCRARRTPEAGCRRRHGAQYHHQHAPDFRCRLARAVRAHEPGGRSALPSAAQFRDMDFPTRNLYRSAIEDLARGANRTELEVAGTAVEAAKQATCTPLSVEEERRGDPGYHLLAGGRRAFEAAIGFRSPPSAWPGRLSRKLGIGGYVGAGLAVAAALLAIPLETLHIQGLSPIWLSLLGVMGVVPAIDAAVALVNRCVTRGFGATLLPALELRGGVPAYLRTLVAVPTMLTTTEAIAEQIERMEVHHLASPEGELHFALLSDWLDAATPSADGDEAAA